MSMSMSMYCELLHTRTCTVQPYYSFYSKSTPWTLLTTQIPTLFLNWIILIMKLQCCQKFLTIVSTLRLTLIRKITHCLIYIYIFGLQFYSWLLDIWGSGVRENKAVTKHLTRNLLLM